MSVPNQTPYIIYNANGLTTVFPFEFYIINAGDIQVSINGEVITTGYSVSGAGNVSGSDIIFLTPPANGTVVMLERVVPTYRLTDYQDNGDLLADTVNKDFDRLWMAIQRSFIYLGLALRRPLFGGPFDAQGYRIAGLGDPINNQDAATKNYVDNVSLVRALRVPEIYVPVLPPVEQRANKLLAFNANGHPIVVLPESGSASDVMIELAKPTGAGLIGYKDGTVADALKYVVTPEMYGAVGDGVTNDVAAFEAAEADAFANNGMLEAHGTYGFSRGFQTRVPFDFSKAKFVIRDDWDGATARYLINYRDPDIYTATMTITAARGASSIPALNTLKNHCVYIESTTEIAYIRAGANIMKQDTVHLINGEVQGLPLVYDFNSSCKITALPLRNAEHVYMPEVVFGVIPATPINHILRIERSNVTSIGGKYDVRSQCVAQNRQAFNAFVNVTRYCYKTTVDGIEGHGWFTEDTGVTNPFSYAANLGGMYATAIRCSDPTIWGLVDGSVVKGMTIDSCMGARMGGHEDWYNLTIQNCTSYTRGFMIGSGRGHLRVLNCKHYYSTNVGNVIEFRYDYSNCCDGVIEVDGLDIYLAPNMQTFCSAIKFNVALTGSLYLSSSVEAKMCDMLTMNNITIHSDTLQANNFEVWNVFSNFTQLVRAPDKISLSNILGTGPVNTYVKISPCNPFYSTNSNMVGVTTDLLVNNFVSHDYVNVKQLDIRISDSDKPNVKNSYRFKFENVRGVHINSSMPSSWFFTFDNNCSIYRIDGSSISGMTDLASYTLNGSVVFGSQCRTNGGKIRLSSVDFTDTLSVGTISILGIKQSSGTTLKAGSIISGQTTLTATILMSYRDNSLYA